MHRLAAVLGQGIGELWQTERDVSSSQEVFHSKRSESYRSFEGYDGNSDAYLECIQLNVGISMGEPLDQSLNSGLGAVGVARHAVANLHDGGPVLRGEILVCGLGCMAHIVSNLLFSMPLDLLGLLCTVLCGNIPIASS